MKPVVFIGSSSERLRVARAIQHHLSRSTSAKVWTDGIFVLGTTPIEALFSALDTCKFAVFVVAADDITTSRGSQLPAPRDNVLFEIGLFMGRLGRRRTFIVYDRVEAPRLPSDLTSLTLAPFEADDNDLLTALAPACFQIEEAIHHDTPTDLTAGHSLRSLVRSHLLSVEIVSKFSGQCLDVSGENVANDTPLHQWTRHHGLNQLWYLAPVDDRFFVIKSKHSGKCVTVLGGSLADNAPVVISDDVGAAYQRWRFVLLSEGTYQISVEHSGMCLSLSERSNTEGMAITQASCVNRRHQRWWLNVAIAVA